MKLIEAITTVNKIKPNAHDIFAVCSRKKGVIK